MTGWRNTGRERGLRVSSVPSCPALCRVSTESDNALVGGTWMAGTSPATTNKGGELTRADIALARERDCGGFAENSRPSLRVITHVPLIDEIPDRPRCGGSHLVNAGHFSARDNKIVGACFPSEVHKHIDLALGMRICHMSVQKPKRGDLPICFDLNRPGFAAALIGYEKISTECVSGGRRYDEAKLR